MQIFNFLVLSEIIDPISFVTPHINKTYLPIASLNVRELKLNWCQKEQSRKKEAPPPHIAWEVEAQLVPQGLKNF